jgi:hypothetical protein
MEKMKCCEYRPMGGDNIKKSLKARNISYVYKKIFTIMERFSLTEIVRKITPKRFDSSEEMRIKVFSIKVNCC